MTNEELPQQHITLQCKVIAVNILVNPIVQNSAESAPQAGPMVTTVFLTAAACRKVTQEHLLADQIEITFTTQDQIISDHRR